MSDYKPTEYVVDFGDCRSNRFVGLNMTLIKQNGANLGERIVRCRDCEYYIDSLIIYNPFCSLMNDRDTEPDGFCAWGVRRRR